IALRNRVRRDKAKAPARLHHFLGTKKEHRTQVRAPLKCRPVAREECQVVASIYCADSRSANEWWIANKTIVSAASEHFRKFHWPVERAASAQSLLRVSGQRGLLI